MEALVVTKSLLDKEKDLRSLLGGCGRSLLAYSGGLDSAYLAVVAQDVLAEGFVAVLADSPSLPDWERKAALAFAAEWDFPVRVIQTRELEREAYRANHPDRCYHCRSELFGEMEAIARGEGFETLLYGGNLSDRSEIRPGHRAAREYRVRAPLEEAGLIKDEIRRLAQRRGMSVWDRPARACLASRIPHFSEVDEFKLRQVAEAERIFEEAGFRNFRVRHHGDLARIELGGDEWSRLADEGFRASLREGVLRQGFKFVSLDLAPFSSGSLSRLSGDSGHTG